MFEDVTCKDCARYEGNCGFHYKDQFGYIDYEVPAEYACDRCGNCNHFKAKERSENEFEIALANLNKHDAELKNFVDTNVLRKALESMIKEGKI